VARDRGDPDPRLGRWLRELAEEVRDVALVARALPAEGVGVDDDEGLVTLRH